MIRTGLTLAAVGLTQAIGWEIAVTIGPDTTFGYAVLAGSIAVSWYIAVLLTNIKRDIKKLSDDLGDRPCMKDEPCPEDRPKGHGHR